MLFNSYIFIFVFLPATLLGFYLLGRRNPMWASGWLAAASLTFYGWWDARYVALLLASIAFNYLAGYGLAQMAARGTPRRKLALGLAIAADLGLLAYFKYANFLVDNLARLTGLHWAMAAIVLPLGISFYTFTQIAFLVDTYQGKVREYRFLHYVLFITYFPHLIAGPVLHHKEMMPQFAHADICQPNWDNLARGLTLFLLGLGKKVLLADTLAQPANAVFHLLAQGQTVSTAESWIGILAYTLQLYFDFSAYSDMAIGISMLFNIRLPQNFDSPYQARSIIDFWRRWHMTLSRFLRDYLYIPLGGNQHGDGRRYANLMITMLLGGLWHGAGWTYVIWGGLHGLYLLVNHAWRALMARHGWHGEGRLYQTAAWMLTLLAVMLGWVFFRADSLASALSLLHSLAGLASAAVQSAGIERASALPMLLLGFAIALYLPNAQAAALSAPESRQGLLRRLGWRPTLGYAALMTLLGYGVLTNLHKPSEFLYFQF
ncbi:MBOAT family protein [Chitinimonas sp.]|uniref:MBOAT family O-acyltransferase n=1 Tax=Chitinimonas sp. TaxID=1934313 RepID=UPI002F9225B6